MLGSLISNSISAFSGEGAGESLSKFNIVELDVSVHVVASSIKKFLKRLPTPLVPHEFHDLLLAAVGMFARSFRDIKTSRTMILSNHGCELSHAIGTSRHLL